MVYINLLPIKKIKQHTKAVQQLTIFGICFVLVIAALGIVGFYQASTAASLEKDIKELNAEKQRYEQILAQVKKLEQDKKIIENKIAVINSLKKTTDLTVHILDEIANLTPTKRIWINSLNQSGMNLNLTGMALDNQTIANYMDTLKTSPYIADVNLIASSLQSYANRNLKSFTLSCVISIPEAKKDNENGQAQPQ